MENQGRKRAEIDQSDEENTIQICSTENEVPVVNYKGIFSQRLKNISFMI